MNNSEERNKLLEVQSWLAEYEALQNERLTSHRYQEMLLEISIIVLGVIVGVIVVMKIFPYALVLTMSLILSCLGLLWVGENRRSLIRSHYLANTIAPALRRLIGSPEIMGGAGYVESAEKAIGRLLIKSTPRATREEAVQPPGRGLPTGILGLREGSRAAFEFLIFFVPSLAGIFVAIYGIFSPEPWYWYCTFLLFGVIILLSALGVNGWRWYKEWRWKAPPEESR